ncbi:MAG: hypothetical protein MUF81_14525 [Verrucomicrobia bacterium]|nr:hypothetical protein [Verrucomicrobiota bacterium]
MATIALIKEDGTGKADANTYASAADADAYHEGHLYASAWTGASAGDKDKALVMATRLIDAEYQFHGYRVKATQALQWPRSNCPDPDADGSVVNVLTSAAVPRNVLWATCEIARELLIVDRTAAFGEGLIATWTATDGLKYSKHYPRPVIPKVAQALLTKYGVLLCSRGAMVCHVRMCRT